MEAVQNVFKSKEQKLRDVLLDMKMAKKSMERQAKKRGEASKRKSYIILIIYSIC